MSKYSRTESCPVPRRNPVSLLPKSPLNRLAYQKQLSDQPTIRRDSFEDRERGLIQRLCTSFGFIECCDRDVRLFFHYSQYNGDPNELQIGDGVEFQETIDRRDKRPLAIKVERVPPEALALELVGDTRVTGTVDCVPKPVQTRKSSDHPLGILNPPRWSQDMGRITCQQKGECFFLSFLRENVEDEKDGLRQGDEVSFFVSTHKRTGAVRAVQVILVRHCEEKTAQGIVVSLKDSFGFIERADEISEIFFHHSEVDGGIEILSVGSHVEFVIQDRHGKPVATNVVKLQPGSIKLEEVSEDCVCGYVQEVYGSPRSEKEVRDHVCGTVQREGAGWDSSFVFYKKDLITTCTLYEQDRVEFKIAADKRNGFERATQVRLTGLADDESSETREVGMVTNLKEGFGFIKCADRDARVFFHFSEAVETDFQFDFGDEVEFSVLEDESSGRESAIRVKVLPRGSVQFETVSDHHYIGMVTRELSSWVSSPTRSSPGERGRFESSQAQGEIEFENEEGETGILTFQDSDLTNIRMAIQVGDQVEFDVCQSKRTGERHAGNVTVVSQREEIWHKGYIAFLKEHFGFIEFMKHNGEIFFHFGSCVSDTSDFSLGCAVKYTVSYKSGRSFAEQVTVIPKEDMPLENAEGETLTGVIVKQLRDTESKSSSKAPYEGLLEYEAADSETRDGEDEENKVRIPFGVTGLVEPKSYLQIGDKVSFQLGYCPVTHCCRAVNISHDRDRYSGMVDIFHSERNFGFITSANFNNDRLFFHVSEVQDGKSVKVGDRIEFSLSFSQKAKKNCAIDLKILSHGYLSPRKTERLRLKENDDSNARVSVLRQPLGPDGTKGFNLKRTLPD